MLDIIIGRHTWNCQIRLALMAQDVNLLGYRQTKVLIALRYSLFWTNLTAQKVEFEVDNVDSNI